MRTNPSQRATSGATSKIVAPPSAVICSVKDCCSPVMARGMCGYHYWTARRAWQRGEAELPLKAKVPEKRIRWSEADLQDVARRLTIESVATVAESYGIKAPGLCGLLKRHGLSAREIRKQHKSGPVSNAGLGLPGSSGVFVGHAAAAVAALAVGQCRWPDGDPREAGFRFCSGAKVAGKPYCAEHMAGAFSGFGRGFPGIATTLAKVQRIMALEWRQNMQPETAETA